MKLESRRDDDKTIYQLEVTDADMRDALDAMDAMDLRMLREPSEGIADTLMDLQILAFRLEQAKRRVAAVKSSG